MAYTTIDDPSAYFQTTIYTGNGGTNAITNSGNSDLQPDLVWLKERSSAGAGLLFDAVRGATKFVRSSDAAAEVTAADTLTAFNSDGFTLGADASNYAANQNSETYVAWNWKKVAGVFDIQTYSGASNTRTISHNLGVVPKAMIFKRLDDGAWIVYHADAGGADKYLVLNTNAAVDTATTLFNNTVPTSSVFSVGNTNSTNGSGIDYVVYLIGNKQGVSKCGSYTGNGNANGPYIHLGFKPAWIMIKGTNIARNWGINDTKRSPINQTQDSLYANVSDAETGSGNYIDFLSNGFKLRDSALTMNGAYNYIYMAFAENPFVTGASAIPATAR